MATTLEPVKFPRDQRPLNLVGAKPTHKASFFGRTVQLIKENARSIAIIAAVAFTALAIAFIPPVGIGALLVGAVVSSGVSSTLATLSVGAGILLGTSLLTGLIGKTISKCSLWMANRAAYKLAEKEAEKEADEFIAKDKAWHAANPTLVPDNSDSDSEYDGSDSDDEGTNRLDPYDEYLFLSIIE